MNSLTRIGKVPIGEVLPILGSECTMHYRNKLEFTFSNKRWLIEREVASGIEYMEMNALGFHIPDMF